MPELAEKTVLKKAVLAAHCDQDERLFSARDCGIDRRCANARWRMRAIDEVHSSPYSSPMDIRLGER
jgi:hypothetical protein